MYFIATIIYLLSLLVLAILIERLGTWLWSKLKEKLFLEIKVVPREKWERSVKLRDVARIRTLEDTARGTSQTKVPVYKMVGETQKTGQSTRKPPKWEVWSR